MVTNLIISVVLTLLELFSHSISQKEYEKKLATILSMEDKNKSYDLGNWVYKPIRSDSLDITHYYYDCKNNDSAKPLVLFLHGMNMDGKSFLKLCPLSSDFNLIAYEFPESTSFYKGKMEDYTRIVSDFCVTMNFDTLNLVGFSFGGMVAVNFYANQNVVHIPKLILLSTFITGVDKNSRGIYTKVNNLIKNSPDYKVYWIAEKLYGLTYTESKKEDQLFKENFIRIKNIGWYRQLFSTLTTYNETPDAKKVVNVPVLLLRGDKDQLVTKVRAEKVNKYIPQAQFFTLNNAGHHICENNPEDVMKYVKGFFKGNTGAL